MSNILTPAQCGLVNALLAGHTSNKELAQALGVRPGTIRRHMFNIFEKTDVRDKTRLVLWALRNGWNLDGPGAKEHPMISRVPDNLRRMADEMETILR